MAQKRRMFLLAAACWAGLAWPASAATFATYDSGDFSELLMTLPGDSVERVLYSVDVGPINDGDILVVDVEGTATNDNTDTAQWTAVIRLGTSAGDVGVTSLSSGNNFGLTHGIHHGVQVKAAVHAFPSGSTSTFVNFVVKSTESLTIDQDHGRIQVLKISP